MTRPITVILLLLLAPVAVLAQSVPGTLTQQAPTLLDACTSAATSATSGGTITITPPGGQSVYICSVMIDNCAGPAAVTPTNPASMTTTNITGSPKWFMGTGVTAGLCQPQGQTIFPRPLKSAVPGTPVTFVLPAFATNQVLSVNVFYYTAP